MDYQEQTGRLSYPLWVDVVNFERELQRSFFSKYEGEASKKRPIAGV